MALQTMPSTDDEFAHNATTARANGSSVTTYATSFQPPEWIVMPNEASIAVRFEVMRVSKSCGVCELGKKLMSVFGREQDGNDFVLANPSVSRKHATVIHCMKGGVYLVDLMSRHGTFVGKLKIPPHDPYLLHEGDIVTFGQSCRTYVLKGTDPNGISQAQKRVWPRLSLPSFFSHSTPKKTSPAKKCGELTTRMVNKICSGALREERIKEFCSQVSELDDEQVEETAILLAEKVRVHNNNAHQIVLALLEDHIGLKEFENHLSTIVQASQNNLQARKILQKIAEARIESGPKTPMPSDDEEPEEESSYAPPGLDSYAPPSVNSYAPPAAESSAPQFVPYAPPMTQSMSRSQPTHTSTDEHVQKSRDRVLSDEGKRLYVSAITSAVVLHDEEEEKEENSLRQASADVSSGFSFIAREPSPLSEAPSAFGFLGVNQQTEDDGTSERSDEEEMAEEVVQVDIPAGFLTQPSMDPLDFENLWQSATSSEEWAVGLVPYFDTNLMERCLDVFTDVKILASGKVGGIDKFFYYAEQASNGTIFMVEIQVTESISELAATFKWIELGLLYDDGHLLFIQLFKECLEPCYVLNHPRIPSLPISHAPPVPSITNIIEGDSFASSLSAYPELDPAMFEELWMHSTLISELEDPEERQVSGIDQVIAQFQAKRLFCLASGSMEDGDKFYFYSELTGFKWLFFMELSISRPDGALIAICKMFAPSVSTKEQEDIASMYVSMVEDILGELE